MTPAGFRVLLNLLDTHGLTFKQWSYLFLKLTVQPKGRSKQHDTQRGKRRN
jgi:hypothetical protein